MTAPTLTEFLLARIAEDELNVEGCTALRHEKIRRECAAKRAIVEYHVEAAKGSGEVAHNSRLEGIIVASSWALHFLVQPYADHPDYDEAWRP